MIDPQTLVEMQDEFDASVPGEDDPEKARAFTGVLACFMAACDGNEDAQAAFLRGGDEAVEWQERAARERSAETDTWTRTSERKGA